jgi:ADP-ribosylglycohydrolase
MSSHRERMVGSLVGLAVCDALGTTLEFKPRGTFTPIDDMVGGGPFGLAPGQWTDDTSMALCLADSLLASGGFDPDDQMRRYLRWWRHGERSSRPGSCFDIGSEAALWAFHRTERFEDGALLAVNLGEDADTTGAVYGQLAGAFYGVDAIPPRWRERLYEGAEIAALAERLCQAAAKETPDTCR